MNCDELKNVASRYLAGESDEGEAAAVENHLASCETCAADLAADRRIDASLREAMLENQPDASTVIRHVIARMQPVPWWRRVFALAPLRLAALASAFLVVFVAGRLLYVHQVEKGLALAATYDHYTDLVVLKRTDWAYNGPSSAQFLQSTFPGNPGLLRSITPAGGSLEKVRICHLERTPYAHFVFQTPGGEVSVFMRARAPGERPYQAAGLHDRFHGLEVAGFSTPDFVGAVVGQEGVPASAFAQQAATAL
jgi:Putative zinc-finger